MPDILTAPDFAGAALINIDLQNDFCLPGAPVYIEGAELVVPRIVQLVRTFRSLGRLIIHVVRLYAPDGSDADICRRSVIAAGKSIVRPGSDGARIVAEVEPGPLDPQALYRGEFQAFGAQEFSMYKPRWGAFFATALDDFLRERGVNTLVFTGVNFPNCVRASMYQASERDYRVVAASDGLIGAYPYGLTELERVGMVVMDNRSITAGLQSALARPV